MMPNKQSLVDLVHENLNKEPIKDAIHKMMQELAPIIDEGSRLMDTSNNPHLISALSSLKSSFKQLMLLHRSGNQTT